jgi:hypothetical protein
VAEPLCGALDRFNPARVSESRSRPRRATLRRILACYFGYYHQARTHLALAKDAPDLRPTEVPSGKIVQLPEVGGRHHRYIRQAGSQRPRSSLPQNGRDQSSVACPPPLIHGASGEFWTVAGLRMSVALFQAWLGAVARRSRMVPSESGEVLAKDSYSKHPLAREAFFELQRARLGSSDEAGQKALGKVMALCHTQF